MTSAGHHETVIILDFGSQYTQVIARRVRECNVYSTILRFDTPSKKIAALKPSGLILSGGPASVYAEDAPLPDKEIFKLGLPVLGICYGVQIFGQFLGGKVESGPRREFGKGTLRIRNGSSPLFKGLPRTLQVWNSHGDRLTKLPRDFHPVAVTENSDYAAIENRGKNFFGLQFHPEVVHTPRGRQIISNFVHGICGCGKDWTMRHYADQAVEEIRARVGRQKVILGLSGGVDSSVAAALIHKAIGDQLTCIFVNNGLLRAREAQVVREVFGRHFQVRLQYEDASKLFLGRLKGVTDPERKRKIIGRTFIEVFQAATRRAGKAEFLAHYYARRSHPLRAHLFGHIDWWAIAAARMPRVVNALAAIRPIARPLQAIAGIAPARRLPRFASQTFQQWMSRHPPRSDGTPVILWSDTFTNYFHPEVGLAARDVLTAAGVSVGLASNVCCGRPLISQGLLREARELAARGIRRRFGHVGDARHVVGAQRLPQQRDGSRGHERDRRRQHEVTASKVLHSRPILRAAHSAVKRRPRAAS